MSSSEAGRRRAMEAIERLLITYLANAVWMTCLVAAAALLLAKLIRHGPSVYRHALWVMALGFASLLPLTSLLPTSRAARDASAVEDTRPSSSLTDMAKVSLPGPLWTRMRRGKAPIPFGSLLTEILAAAYFGLIALRGLF